MPRTCNALIVIVGAAGFVGASIAGSLAQSGHRLAGVIRSAASLPHDAPLNMDLHQFDILTEPKWRETLTGAKAVILAASGRGEMMAQTDAVMLEAALEAARTWGTRVVYTSGTAIYPDGSALTEAQPIMPPPMLAFRRDAEERLRQAAHDGLPVHSIRLGWVLGDGGIAAAFRRQAARRGEVGLVGTGANGWPVVHACDLGSLYSLAVRGALEPGPINAVGSVKVTQQAVAGWAVRHERNVAMHPLSPPAARKTYGLFADVMARDQHVDASKARAAGWIPSHTDALNLELSVGV